MAEYAKPSTVSGSWVKAAELTSGSRAMIVSETKPSPSTFFNKDGSIKMQDVAKVKFEGKPEALNVNINRATLVALIDAFGTDSNNWKMKELKVETEKVKVAGKTVTALYLIPQGYTKRDNAEGYTEIVKDGQETVQPAPAEEIPTIQLDSDEEEIKIEDVPF